MARSRKKVQEIGFWDAEVGELTHDAVQLWAHRNAAAIAAHVFPHVCGQTDWQDQDLEYWSQQSEEVRSEALQLRSKTPYRPPEVTVEWEFPLFRFHERGRPESVGYADLLIRIYTFRIRESRGKVVTEWDCNHKFLVEVKGAMPTMGELFRQLQIYRTAFTGPIVVVSPDARFADLIREQRFFFVQAPCTATVGFLGS